ncbi:hypothetical protein PFFCH_00179 [Plasmodium falciparum FCH/4]|uniref:Uncharacterized protein n=1 Tax=Plasmodium falciparum FCH/4 TaxID=1036724 RepID=A0A024VVT1_PLAFA|nr:hypothetical protein PFFCH_00179 [Plasmodium falciparum FCH/4]
MEYRFIFIFVHYYFIIFFYL